MSRVFPLLFDSSIATADEVVVFPTPPFPPTNINYKVVLSNISLRVLFI